MEIDQFRKVVQNYPSSSIDEAEELHSLSKIYPYSQLLRVLAARASKDHGLTDQQNDLQLAAVYSADRGILKNMMGNNPLISGSVITPITSAIASQSPPIAAELEVSDEKNSETPETQNEGDSDNLADRVIKDVKALYKTRHNFEMMFTENPDAPLNKIPSSGDDHVKSKRERIIELSKALNAQPMTEGEEHKATKKKREERKDIMDEIVHSRGEIVPESEKQKEQLEIIDHFIKVQPSISSAKDKPPHIKEGDLSTIKTGEFGENIVSETLVELLLKQGKKDKAIEVLKKLIWKFPQKKSYFAAQIEDLKK
ncbi:tetratricopeptide repeat protein [Chryseolinea sp. H1M3-3]|uniref:tetratricopeptide repeat protein n=1 Tax=Chryseolinea sp. H1M3-3 TaxID=3034144 RepID=UPI0023EB1F3B|nr:tetratricopeptide repeat protein [Chryseolinea sp. H1M3-3]